MNNLENLTKLRRDLRLKELGEKLGELNIETKNFNSLNMLKVAHREFVHSATIAWLLNPDENHELGDRFLKLFLNVIRENIKRLDYLETTKKKHLATIDEIVKSNLIDKLSVKHEKENIDILVEFLNFETILLIENKFKSSEHSDQLNRYYEYAKNADEFDNYHVIPVFLRLNIKEEASHDEYINVNYDDIMKCLKYILDNEEGMIKKEVYLYLKQYVNILKENSVMDNDIKKLCKEIYKENKLAIDELLKYKEEIENTEPDRIIKQAEFSYQGTVYIAQEYLLKTGKRNARIICKETGEKPEIQKPILRNYLYEKYNMEIESDKNIKTTYQLIGILIKNLLSEAR